MATPSSAEKLNRKTRSRRRQSLTQGERAQILASTGRRCHICGGKIRTKWQSDHVLAHAANGRHRIDNCLPVHRLCNHYRWDFSPEEFQSILKLGVWTRTHIESATPLGAEVRASFLKHEHRRHGRRRT